MNEDIITECGRLPRLERVKRLAQMIWRKDDENRRRRKVGVCQFCGKQLAVAYRVAKDGQLHDCATGSNAAARAKKIIDSGSGPFDLMVFPLSSCEAMTGEELYRDAERLVAQWRRQWKEEDERKRQQARVAARATDDEAIPSSVF